MWHDDEVPTNDGWVCYVALMWDGALWWTQIVRPRTRWVMRNEGRLWGRTHGISPSVGHCPESISCDPREWLDQINSRTEMTLCPQVGRCCIVVTSWSHFTHPPHRIGQLTVCICVNDGGFSATCVIHLCCAKTKPAKQDKAISRLEQTQRLNLQCKRVCGCVFVGGVRGVSLTHWQTNCPYALLDWNAGRHL